MEETPQQSLTPARPPQRRRFRWGPAHVAWLLALPAAGLALAAWTAVERRPPAKPNAADQTPLDFAPADEGASPSGSLQEILAHPDLIPSHDHPLLGRKAPDFELADSDGKIWSLKEMQADGPVLLIFYQGFTCVHCVRQLFDVRRDLPLFREAGARVAAVSADPPELTRRRLQKYGPFGFPLLSDPRDKVRQAYSVFRRAADGTTTDLPLHGTFIIDRAGTVRWVNVGDAPFRRNAALLYQIARAEDGMVCSGGNRP